MKTLPLFFMTLALTLGVTTTVRSHAQAPRKAPLEVLKQIQTDNKKLIDYQTGTMSKLDELLENARQLRIFVRRV